MNHNQSKEIILAYYVELQKGFRTKKLDATKLHLDDNVKVIAPNERFEGKQNVEQMLINFIGIVDRFDIQKQYFDENSCCTILDCVTSTPAGTVLTTEWIKVKEGRIVEIYAIFDTAAWAKALPPQEASR